MRKYLLKDEELQLESQGLVKYGDSGWVDSDGVLYTKLSVMGKVVTMLSATIKTGPKTCITKIKRMNLS